MPLRFTNRIVGHLAHPNYRPSSAKAISRDLKVEAEDKALFLEAVDMLARDQRVDIGEDSLLRLPNYGDEIIGEFRLNVRGFGFVKPDKVYRHGDLFVPRGAVRDAISGDRVRATVVHETRRAKPGSGRSPYTGRIAEVLERGRDNFVGKLFEKAGQWFVEPDGKSLYEPVLIRDPHTKNANAGDKVVIEMLHYPDDQYTSEGVIVEVLGEAGKPDVETQAVIVAHGLRTEFDDDALNEARDAAKSLDAEAEKGWPNREDLTNTFIFTIDPPDAKDFDDAISIDFDQANNEWTLGVHIADVSHYVKRNKALDIEANKRGNSVYLPRLVIPMLPEILSNGVCSLQEDVLRLTKSVFITFDTRGKVVNQRLAATVIRSRKRLTYLEAQALIDDDIAEARKHARTDTDYTDELIDTLKQADSLARRLRKRRMRDGMIVLNLPDVELVFDDQGHVIDAVPEDDAYTHKIIEMFMVEANEALARAFDALTIAILRRIHPDPVPGDIEELRMYALAASIDLPAKPTRKDLQRLLDATRDTPASRAIHFAVLRTLTKATYSPAIIGHFALASDHYAHFTSPIRRYPDLTLHRALSAYLDATNNGKKVPGGKKWRALSQTIFDDDRVLDEGELIELGKHCSDTEVEATAAERELRDFLVMQFLYENHLGDEFPGVITGIISSGVFVSIEQYLVEGMVRMTDMPQAKGRADRWELNERTGRLVAQRSGNTLGIGDIVTVLIQAIDLGSRHLDLAITKLPQRQRSLKAITPTRASRAEDPPRGKRKGYKKGRRGRKSL
ncbi:MAG: VacB/RNase II family 3'-5' exoribonuclease [Planctomycetes bacterium]|nr:VacB/RNase II family 3'-5' exoribonuclease [Planctomycetota bacterium]